MYRLKSADRERLLAYAAQYSEDDLSLFIGEIGWEEWMNDFTEAAEEDPITEEEEFYIDEILKEIFWLAHGRHYHKEILYNPYRHH